METSTHWYYCNTLTPIKGMAVRMETSQASDKENKKKGKYLHTHIWAWDKMSSDEMKEICVHGCWLAWNRRWAHFPMISVSSSINCHFCLCSIFISFYYLQYRTNDLSVIIIGEEKTPTNTQLKW